MLSARRQSVCTLLVCFSLLCCGRAWADGKVFARALAVPVRVPDQRAMLYFSNGVERLVIETSFIGEGTNFAWVIPLPSAPKIEAVSTNFFRALSFSFQPKLIHKQDPWWLLVWFFGIIVGTIIHGERKGGCFPGCLVSGALMFFLLLVALPTLGPPGCGVASTSPQASSVKVIDRRTVGVYDTAVLSGPNGRELLTWLNRQGFYTPTSALPVISSYATQRWVFAAATLNRESGVRTNSQPHPLAFTFRSEAPVYPLRLTGVENDSCAVELFVFGPERAEAAGFRVEHCGRPFAPELIFTDELWHHAELFRPPNPGQYRFGVQEVRDLAMPAAVTTKLVGRLRPRDMQADAWIRWVPFRPALPVLYSEGAAACEFFNWFTGVFVFGALLIQILSPRLRIETCTYAGVGVFVLATVCGFVRGATLETTPVRMVQSDWSAVSSWRAVNAAVTEFAQERTGSGPLTWAELRMAVDGYKYIGVGRNTFTGEPLRNEASPGNLTLRPSSNMVEVLWYDIEGEGHVMAIFKSASD